MQNLALFRERVPFQLDVWLPIFGRPFLFKIKFDCTFKSVKRKAKFSYVGEVHKYRDFPIFVINFKFFKKNYDRLAII